MAGARNIDKYPYTPTNWPGPKKRKLNRWWVWKWIFRTVLFGGVFAFAATLGKDAVALLGVLAAAAILFGAVLFGVDCEIKGKSKYKGDE